MLRELHISNFILIDQSRLSLHPGFNVFTGETGAGKSMVIEAIRALLGGRVSPELIRAGQSEAVLQAVFDLDGSQLINPSSINPPYPPFTKGEKVSSPTKGERMTSSAQRGKVPSSKKEKIATPHRLIARLNELGYQDEDLASGQLIIRRVISRTGKHRLYVNDHPMSVSAFAELADDLVDITDQDEHQSLLSLSAQRDVLDLESPDIALAREAYRVAYRQAETIQASLEILEARYVDLKRAEDYTRYQLEQLKGIDLDPDLELRLVARRAELKADSSLALLLKEGEALFESRDQPLFSALTRFIARAREADRESGRLAASLSEMDDAVIRLREGYAAFVGAIRHVSVNERELDDIESQLSTIKQLQRKFHLDMHALAEKRDAWKADMAWLDGAEAERATLIKARDHARAEAGRLAVVLTAYRKDAARAMSQRVTDTIHRLGMPKAQFSVVIDTAPLLEWSRFSDSGADTIQFLFTGNAGQALKPLAKVASGGERSRVLLAIKASLSHGARRATAIFDEIDAGVGGQTADWVGQVIREVSERRQVLAVTHLAQVAQYADRHFKIEKREADDRTGSTIECLSADAEADELARMLGGDALSHKTREVAVEILSRRRRGAA